MTRLSLLLLLAVIIAEVPVTRTDLMCSTPGWTVIQRTKSCYALFESPKYHSVAKRKCESYREGTAHQFTGHLVKVDDAQKEKLVAELLSEQGIDRAWIGLTYDPSMRFKLHWDGFPNQMVKYHKVEADGSKKFRVYLTKSASWIRVFGFFPLPYICEVTTNVIKSHMLCNGPAKANTRIEFLATCHYDEGQWNEVQFFSPKNKVSPVAECRLDTSICPQVSPDYLIEVNVRRREARLVLNKELTRTQHEGNWTCALKGTKVKRICNMALFEPAKSLTCRGEAIPEYVSVKCEVDRIWPDATCRFSYKHEGLMTFQAATYRYIYDQRPSVDKYFKLPYFRTMCEIRFTAMRSLLKFGENIIKVNIYPGTMTSEGKTMETPLTLEAPDPPTFYLSENRISGESASLIEDKFIELICTISSGYPPAYSTWLKCDFPINPKSKKDPEVTMKKGTSNVLMIKVTRAMDGKSCKCWGSHMTGMLEKTSLRLEVMYKPVIKRFVVNGNGTNDAVKANTQVNMECQTSGNPKPLVTIMYTQLGGGGKISVMRKKSLGNVYWNFKAECTTMGNYTCRADNRLPGDYATESTLTLRVICPPTVCDNSDTSVRAAQGEKIVIDICMVAYPPPPLSFFRLRKDTQPLWDFADDKQVSLTLKVREDTLAGVTIVFWNVSKITYGSYFVVFSDGNATGTPNLGYRVATFDLIGSADPATSHELSESFRVSRILLFSACALGILLTLVALWLLVRRMLRRSQPVKGEHDHEEDVHEEEIEHAVHEDGLQSPTQ